MKSVTFSSLHWLKKIVQQIIPVLLFLHFSICMHLKKKQEAITCYLMTFRGTGRQILLPLNGAWVAVSAFLVFMLSYANQLHKYSQDGTAILTSPKEEHEKAYFPKCSN